VCLFRIDQILQHDAFVLVLLHNHRFGGVYNSNNVANSRDCGTIVTLRLFDIIAGKPAGFPVQGALPPPVILLGDGDDVALLKTELEPPVSVSKQSNIFRAYLVVVRPLEGEDGLDYQRFGGHFGRMYT
jgi:hypothetical protein